MIRVPVIDDPLHWSSDDEWIENVNARLQDRHLGRQETPGKHAERLFA
jgi:hypothetical protein